MLIIHFGWKTSFVLHGFQLYAFQNFEPFLDMSFGIRQITALFL